MAPKPYYCTTMIHSIPHLVKFIISKMNIIWHRSYEIWKLRLHILKFVIAKSFVMDDTIWIAPNHYKIICHEYSMFVHCGEISEREMNNSSPVQMSPVLDLNQQSNDYESFALNLIMLTGGILYKFSINISILFVRLSRTSPKVWQNPSGTWGDFGDSQHYGMWNFTRIWMGCQAIPRIFDSAMS